MTQRRYSRACPEESDNKRTARMFVYRLAQDAPRLGHAIALAGPEPDAEVDLMRSYLGWPGERVHFVDWAKDIPTRPRLVAALERVKRRWPEANAVLGDINHVVERLPLVGFANLDFMGFSRDSVMPCVRRTLERLVPGGVLALTWFRGREVVHPNRSAWDIVEAARDLPDPRDRRWAGVVRLVDRWARERKVTVDLKGALEYQHYPHGAMSVVVWQRRFGDGERA